MLILTLSKDWGKNRRSEVIVRLKVKSTVLGNHIMMFKLIFFFFVSRAYKLSTMVIEVKENLSLVFYVRCLMNEKYRT